MYAEHLKSLILDGCVGLEAPFDLAQLGDNEAMEDDGLLSDYGLVSGNAVWTPPMIDLWFEMPDGCTAKKGRTVKAGTNQLHIRVEPHQTIEHLRDLILHATKGLKPDFVLKALSDTVDLYDQEDRTLEDYAIESDKVLAAHYLQSEKVQATARILAIMKKKSLHAKERLVTMRYRDFGILFK